MMTHKHLLAGTLLALLAMPVSATAPASDMLIDKTPAPIITVTAHALRARRHAEAGLNEARKAEQAGHKGAAAAAAHRAAAEHFRAAAKEHDAAARKLG